MALTAIDILSTIRDEATLSYIERVPEYTRDNLEQVGKAITSDGNIMNEFLPAMINKVAFSHTKNRMYKNELSRLKSIGIPYGNTIEEIYINPAIDVGYDTDGTKLLKTTKPDGKVCYYGLNRQSSYPITISEDELARAFTNEQEFMSLYNGIVTSMYSGDEIDEFLLTKGVLSKAVDEGAIRLLEVDVTKPKEIAKAISNLSKTMRFPSTQFAGYNLVNSTAITAGETECITYCKPDRQVLIIRSDIQTEIDYEVLATMFHMEVAQLEAMTILIDSFPSEDNDIYAILCDIDAIQIRDTTYKTTSQYIASNLQWNFWLHHWQFLFVSMFGNAIALGKKIEVVEP